MAPLLILCRPLPLCVHVLRLTIITSRAPGRVLSFLFVLCLLGILAGVSDSLGCCCTLCCVFVLSSCVVSLCLVSLIGLLHGLPCFRSVRFGAFRGFLFFVFCLNLWRRGSIPRRSWRSGGPSVLLVNPSCGVACLCHSRD